MAAYRGILMTVKDKNTVVPTKLKLLKFAWAKPDVVIPNKHQQILDFVCVLLVNKKKNNLDKKDEILTWKSLVEFLQASGSTIAVKPSILYAVNDNILAFVKNKNAALSEEDKTHLGNLVGCGSCLVSIPAIQSSLFSSLCHLLSSLCQLCVLVNQSDVELLSKTQALLRSTVSVLARRQTTYHNQMQVVSLITDMFPAIVRYQDVFADQNLQNFVVASLFSRDHKEAHSAYIKSTFGEGEPAKKMAKVYAKLSEQMTSSYLASRLLPAFAEEFLKQNRGDSGLCFSFLKYTLTTLLKLTCDPVSEASMPTHLAPDAWIACLGGCFKACQSVGCDVFATDNRQEVTRWFCCLVEVVLPYSSVRCWCGFMSALVGLSPLVTEKYLTDILKGALSKGDTMDAEIEAARDSLLSELVAIFVKLRRMPDFLSSLLLAIDSGVSLHGTFSSSTKFKAKLGEMFSTVPSVSVMGMWEKVENGLESALRLEKGKDRSNKLAWLFLLLNSLLSHARFFDQRSMGVTQKKLHSLLEATETNVLAPLSKTKNIKNELPIFGDILTTWASVKMLLYPKWREQSSETSPDVDGGDHVTTKTINKKVSVATKVRLLLQRRQVATPGDTNNTRQEEVNELMGEVMDFPAPNKDNVFASCDGHEKVTPIHAALVQFQEFSGLFPLVGHRLSDALIQQCAEFVVDVVSLKEGGSAVQGAGGRTCLYTQVEEFLRHPATREHSRFQAHLASLVWSRLLAPVSGKVSSPKKKKMKKSESDIGLPTVGTKLLAFVTDAKMKELDFDIVPDEIGKSLKMAESSSMALIELLMSLDLEFLPLVCLKSQLGFLAMVACLQSGDVTDKDEITHLVETALIRCLSGQNLESFFSCVKPRLFLEYSLSLCSQPSKMSRRFLECCIQVVMTNTSAVVSILPLVKQIATELRCEENAKVKATTILAASQIIRNCRRYIARSFRMVEVSNAAMDIFCCLSKTAVKRVIDWIDNSDDTTKTMQSVNSVNRKTGRSQEDSGSVKTNKQSQKGKKRKNIEDEEGDQDGSLMKNVAGAGDDVVCASAECVTEILLLWSHDIADDRMNQQLSTAVHAIRHQMEKYDFTREGISEQTQLVFLHFIKAVCLCHSRLSSRLPSSASNEDDSSPSQTQSSSQSDAFRLLDDQFVMGVWQTAFGAATSQLSKLARKDGGDAAFVDNAKSVKTDCKESAPDNETKRWTGFAVEEMSSWPKPLVLHLDVLVCVMETRSEEGETFARLLGSLNQHLMESPTTSQVDLTSMFVSLAVWRRLMSLSFVSDRLATEMMDQLYKVLSSSLNLLQKLDQLKVKSSKSSSSTPSATSAATTTITTSKSTSPSANSHQTSNAIYSTSTLGLHMTASACRFIMDTLSDFISFAKTTNTPEITTVCLQGGPMFTLECPRDIQALQRLVSMLVVHYPPSAIRAASAVMALVSKLVCVCVRLGSQSRLTRMCPGQLEELVKCAQLISRVMESLTSADLKTDVGKIAHGVLSDYVHELQKGALHPRVKTELVRGLYALMDISDKFRLAALNAALPAGLKDTFRFMHQDFEKYFKYQGTV